MMSETKSVFLYGKPTVCKTDALKRTQESYCNLINRFIEELSGDNRFLLNLLNNNKQAPMIRELEKQVRKEHKLGSAYGQNAVDFAVKELHNHYIRIRNKVYGYVQQHLPEMEEYISYKSLLNAAIMGENELMIIQNLIDYENEKKKPSKTKLEEYQNLKTKLNKRTKEQRSFFKETISTLFLERLAYSKLPLVKKVPLQLDSRLSTIEDSHSTKENFVVFVKLEGEKDRIPFPVSTSTDSLRRMKQYQTGSMTVILTKNGKVRIGVPFKKNIEKQKNSKKNLLTFDVGITDLINTNTGNNYGTFKGMTILYQEWVEPKLRNRSSLRNLMREHQKQLKKSDNDFEKQVLRNKISHIASSLNGKKSKDKCLRKYNHQVDLRLNEAVSSLIKEAKINKFTCVYEDLEITEFDRGKKNNKRNSMWIRGQLIKKIQSKLDWLGINHFSVDPAYTSKACPKCSNIDNKNRNGKSFVCTVCKHKDDADHNAAINIELRAFDEDVKGIVEKYKYSIKKRHTTLKELYAKRHRSYLDKASA
jgi:IS605 OrfB family transposase